MDNKQEFFLFFGVRGKLVLHNTLIEGSMFNASKSLHTERAASHLFIKNTGLVYSNLSTTFKLTMHALSPEVVGGSGLYLSIDLAVRF